MQSPMNKSRSISPLSPDERATPAFKIKNLSRAILSILITMGLGSLQWLPAAPGDLHLGLAIGLGYSDRMDGFDKNLVGGRFQLETPVLSANWDLVHGFGVGLQAGLVGAWTLDHEELENARFSGARLQGGFTLGWRGPLSPFGKELLFQTTALWRGAETQPWELGVEAGLMDNGVGYRFKAWYLPEGADGTPSRLGLSAYLVFEWGMEKK